MMLPRTAGRNKLISRSSGEIVAISVLGMPYSYSTTTATTITIRV
jgi:hypothetical protein